MKTEIPQISPGNENNLKVLRQAAANNDLALVVCYDRQTNNFVDAVCAVTHHPEEVGEEFTMAPFAIMEKHMPLFERLVPCTEPEAVQRAIEAAQEAEVCSPAERNWIEAQMRINVLEAHLMRLADGVLSKRMLLLSKSPTSKYIDVPDLLLAIATEAKDVINEVGKNETQH